MRCYVALLDQWTHPSDTADALARRFNAALNGAVVDVEVLRLAPAPPPPPGPRDPHTERPAWLSEAATYAMTITSPALSSLGDATALDVVRHHLGTSHAWAVDRHIMIDLDGAREDPAIARLGFLTRASGLDTAAFGRHWLRQHAPLVVRHGPLFARYEAHVAHAVGAEPPWDGMVIQWFANQDDWDRHDELIATEKTAVREDITRYVGSAYQFMASDLKTTRTS